MSETEDYYKKKYLKYKSKYLNLQLSLKNQGEDIPQKGGSGKPSKSLNPSLQE